MADVVEVDNLEELASYRLLWQSLFPDAPRASFFHTYDWFATYWKHFGRQRQMRVLVIRAAGSPIGIVPLCVGRERYHLGNLRVLTYPLSDWGLWYGPIGANQSGSMFMATKHLLHTRRDWDMVDLRWVPAQHAADSAVSRAMWSAGWNPRKSIYQQSSILHLSGYDWNSYFSSRSKKWRHETRRQLRALQRQGKVSFQRHRPAGMARGDSDPRWDLYEDCLVVSKRSWQAQSKLGNTLCREHVQPFLRDCHQAAAKLGMLDLTLLRVDGRPVAFQYNYCYEGTIYGLRMGYDRELSQLCAGNVLLHYSLEDSFQRADHSIELGIGDFPFKRRLRTDVEASYRFTYYPWSAWRAQGVRLTRWLKSRRTETATIAKATKPDSA